jgi:hypothetical protein
MRSSHSFPVSTQSLRSLRSTNIEKHFKVSHNKESHKVKVLARIYFSITGESIDKVGEGRGREKNISCSPQRKWEHRLKMVVPNSKFYTGELGEYSWLKLMGLGG